MQTPQIVEKPTLKVVGIERPFIHGLSPETNNFKVIPPMWEAICHSAGEVTNRVGKEMYGIIYERPESERAHPHELQYIAAVAVSSEGKLSEGMVSRTIPAGTFAVFLHRGPIAKIAETCREIYREWLPRSEWEHSGIADVELYDERFDCESDSSVMEYWISVKPKGSNN